MLSKLMECACHERIIKIAQCKITLLEKYFSPLLLLFIRLYMANIFWKSGVTKVEGTTLFGYPVPKSLFASDSATMLFEYEYFGSYENLPEWFYSVSAQMAVFGELGASLLLAIGLFGRGAAAALLIMAAVIELFVYPGTNEHYYWMMLYAVVIAYGAGMFSFDHHIRNKYLKS